MKKILLGLLLLLGVLIAVLLFNTFTVRSKQPEAEPVVQFPLPERAAAHLSSAIRIPTLSYEDTALFKPDSFLALHAFLRTAYPLVHQRLSLEKVNRYSLLYAWQGSNDTLAPVVLLAHQDVVPAHGANALWEKDPFGGEIEGGYLWGRGSMDDKYGIISIMEAIEKLLQEEHVPERTVYLAFGHDEETGGENGAKAIAALLESRGVRAEFVLDEGLAVTQGIVKGIDKPVALIGTAEKGYASVRLEVTMPGGHSSHPPYDNAVAVLSEAISRLRENQMPAYFCNTFDKQTDYFAPEMDLFNRFAISNKWLLKPVIFNMLSKSPAMNAAIRTTTAPTIFHAGVKDNVLPENAYAVVNFRLLPGTYIDDVIDHIHNTVNDKRILVSVSDHQDASKESPTDTKAFKTMSRLVKAHYPDAVVTPSLVIGGTDAKHYAGISENIYRFLPITVNDVDLARIHGSNERVSLSDLKTAVNFYYNLVKTTTGKEQ